MMLLQKYQFDRRDCSHIFSCHKEAGISLAKKYKSFKFTVETGAGQNSNRRRSHHKDHCY
jgi:hypothetical protein